MRITSITLGKFSIILAASLFLAGPSLCVTRKSISESEQRIHTLWTCASSQPICLTMTQDGKFIGSVDGSGTVRFLDAKGSLLWQKKVEGATDMLVARNGESVLVYSKLNPIHTEVSFFRANGLQLWHHKVEGPIWAAAVSADGDHVAVTTGKKYVYAYSPDPRRPKYHRWRIDGIGRCLAFTPDSESIIIGTWQKSGISSYTLAGALKWSSPHAVERQYDLKVSLDGKMVMELIPGRPLSPRIELGLWTSEGKLLWRHALDGYEGRALISPASQFIALSYSYVISHRSTEIVERKVAVYRADGSLAWQKGGLFLGLNLVALSPKGSSVIVWDGEKTLYEIDSTGRVRSKLMLPGMVRQAVSTDDGRRILLYCSNGIMCLLDVG